MANLTRMKILTTGATTTAPANIKTGELAYSYVAGTQANNGDRLYIGTGTEVGGVAPNVDVIGGKYFTGMLDHAGGTLTASSAIIVDSNSHIDALNVETLRIDASGGTGQTVTSIETVMAGTPTNSQLISALAVKNYVDGQVTAQDLDISDGSTTGAIDLDSETMTIQGTASEVEVSLSGNAFTVGLPASVSIATELTAGSAIVSDLTDNRIVIAGTSGALEDDANFTFDGSTFNVGGGNFTVAQATGNTLVNGTLETNGEATLASAVIEDLTNNRIVIAGTGGAVEDDANLTFDGTTFNVGATNFSVTAATGNTTVGGTLQVNGDTTLGNAGTDTVTTTGDQTVGGDLTVNGAFTTVNSTTVTVDDIILTLGGDTAPVADDNLDRGIEYRYFDGSAKLGFFGFDDSTGRFVFIPDATNTSGVMSGALGDIDVGGVYSGNIQVGITGDNEIDTGSGNLTIDSAGGTTTIDDNLSVTGTVTLTNDLAVTEGGTGLSSFTGDAVFISNAAGTAISFLTGTEGDLIQFNASGNPIASNIIDGGTY